MEIKEAISRIEGILDPYPCAPSFSVETCEALEIAIGALKTQLSQEGTTKDTTSDTISRQAAIDALAKQMPTPYTPDGSHPADEGIFQVQEVYADCIETLELLPPAQPEERTKKRTGTHTCDCISRKDAIRWIRTECNPYGKPTLDFESGKRVMKYLEQMPPAQPEPERTMEEFMYGQDMGNPEDGSL